MKNTINSQYDLIVIGSGPAGEGAAMMAAKYGKKVLVIEKNTLIGGGCTHWGTIPSKTIRQAIVALLNLRKLPYIGREHFDENYTFKKLIDMTQSVIKTQVEIRESHYQRNQVKILSGVASFLDKETIKVVRKKKEEIYQAQNFVLAAGSIPYHSPLVDFSHPLILDSNMVLKLDRTPKSISICGAGIVGVEYACIFKNLGIKVDLINTRTRVMDFLDDEITDAFNYHMRDLGIVIRNQETIRSVIPDERLVTLNLESGKSIKHEFLLWAQGRTGNIKDLNLKAAEIKTNERGYVSVNDNYQTDAKNIYAAGDIIGWPNLSSTAYDQGCIASVHICNIQGYPTQLGIFPTGIYTTPEISCIGKTEQELTDEKVPYEIGKANFKNVAKAQILGDTTGILKILFHRKTKEILGIHCFGRQAADVIHIGQAIMKNPPPHNTIYYFIETTFNYPTMAEAYRIAALNGLNRL